MNKSTVVNVMGCLALTGMVGMSGIDLGADRIRNGAAVGRRGAAVKGDEGYAAVGRRGAVVGNEEGSVAVGRRGTTVRNEEGKVTAATRRGYGYGGGGAVAVKGEERTVVAGTNRYGRGGVAVVGEEGAFVAGGGGYRPGYVVGGRYESYEGWKVAAGVATGIAVGTMLARPPRNATTVVVGGSSYYYADNAYYTRVMAGGTMSYQVVAPPVGIIVPTLPGGCSSVRSGNVTYTQCGPTYYQRVNSGYQVVVLR
jgi:hypothetical protein